MCFFILKIITSTKILYAYVIVHIFDERNTFYQAKLLCLYHIGDKLFINYSAVCVIVCFYTVTLSRMQLLVLVVYSCLRFIFSSWMGYRFGSSQNVSRSSIVSLSYRI